jgi:putative PIN family toxin of toxin-antitoxin system
VTGDRVVFDCMVFLQAVARENGPAAACLRLIEDGRLTLCLSPDVFAEVSEVLCRPKLQRKFRTLTPERVSAFLERVRAKAVWVEPVPRAFQHPRDPKDEPYVNLALAAGARYLVSRDNDLLDLMTDETFRQRFPELLILDPVALLRSQPPREVPRTDPPPGEPTGSP